MKALSQDGEKPRKPRKPRKTKNLHAVNVGGHPQYTPAQFIEAYIKCGCSVTHAALLLGCSRELHYIWLSEMPEYPAMIEKAREIFINRADFIANDCLGAYEDISALRLELMKDPETAPQPDDTPDVKRAKRNLRRARLNEAQDFNKYAIDMSKHVHKLRGSKAGWRDKIETELHAGPSFADMINKGAVIPSISLNTQAPNKPKADGVAGLLGD